MKSYSIAFRARTGQARKYLHERLGEEQRVLNTMENWGASLFLGAIGLTCKQIIDWSFKAEAATLLQWQIYLAPALLGLTAFIFLRVVNHRIRDVRDRQYNNPQGSSGKGTVGWAMALMPLLFGNIGTGYFTLAHPEASCGFWIILSGSIVAFVIAYIQAGVPHQS
jgi:hypothetical protein